MKKHKKLLCNKELLYDMTAMLTRGYRAVEPLMVSGVNLAPQLKKEVIVGGSRMLKNAIITKKMRILSGPGPRFACIFPPLYELLSH